VCGKSLIITSQGVNHTQYADDEVLKVASTSRICFEAVPNWLAVNGLSVNPAKREAIAASLLVHLRANVLAAALSISPKTNLTTSHTVRDFEVLEY